MLGAGASTRMKTVTKKQWLRTEDDPLWYFLAKTLQKYTKFEKIVVTASEDEINYMKKFASFEFVAGGETRQESLKNALKKVKSKYVLVTDIARTCVPEDMIKRILSHKDKADIIVPFLSVSDTVVYETETINRDDVKLIQTPQLSVTNKLKNALGQDETFTDDSSAMKAAGYSVFYTKGSEKAHKLTFLSDLKKIDCIKSPSKDTMIGHGYDVHQFEKGKKMFLCGVEIKSDVGFKAHSDGDIALHALIDSLLGAVGAGDIGELFPDNDDKYKDIDSKKMLKNVVDFIKKVGFEVINSDITIIAQKPKLSAYKHKMRKTIAEILNIEPIKVNIKATTTEKLGFVGKEEGVVAQAVSSLKYYDWTK